VYYLYVVLVFSLASGVYCGYFKEQKSYVLCHPKKYTLRSFSASLNTSGISFKLLKRNLLSLFRA
jgi:hypothetical protein